jgi:hypothetical protein
MYNLPSSRLRPSGDVIARRLDQDSVLVHIQTSRIFELNATGTRVWELLGEGLNVDRIVLRLVDEFEVDQAQAAKEVEALVGRLRADGLLV